MISSRNKNIIFAILVVAVFSVVVTSASMVQAAKPSDNPGKGKQLKCNNIKIMAIVTGLDTTKGTIFLTGSATLQGVTVQKNIAVNASDESEDDGVGLPLFFKKSFTPCPALGTSYSGVVNGVTFTGVLQSLSKPNTVEVDLTGLQQASSAAAATTTATASAAS